MKHLSFGNGKRTTPAPIAAAIGVIISIGVGWVLAGQAGEPLREAGREWTREKGEGGEGAS